MFYFLLKVVEKAVSILNFVHLLNCLFHSHWRVILSKLRFEGQEQWWTFHNTSDTPCLKWLTVFNQPWHNAKWCMSSMISKMYETTLSGDNWILTMRKTINQHYISVSLMIVCLFFFFSANNNNKYKTENDPLIRLIAFVHDLLQFDVHSFKLMMVCFSLTPFYRFLRSTILVGKSKPHWVPLNKRVAPSNEYWVNHWNHNIVFQEAQEIWPRLINHP